MKAMHRTFLFERSLYIDHLARARSWLGERRLRGRAESPQRSLRLTHRLQTKKISVSVLGPRDSFKQTFSSKLKIVVRLRWEECGAHRHTVIAVDTATFLLRVCSACVYKLVPPLLPTAGRPILRHRPQCRLPVLAALTL